MEKNKKVLITGASGMLGSALLARFAKKYQCSALDIKPGASIPGVDWISCELTDVAAAKEAVKRCCPDVVIHCAALVNVDLCESNIEKAYSLHVGSTRTLSEECQARNIGLIYISTDSVFDGNKNGAYTELDEPAPLNTYARTKFEGEKEALKNAQGLVLRTNIFGWTEQGKSFAEWILEGLRGDKQLTMFTDVFFTPISTFGLADVISLCIDKSLKGLYHAGGGEVLSKFDFAIKVSSIYGLSADRVIPVVLDDVKLTAPRAKNMALDSSKLSQALDFNMPDVAASLKLWKSLERA
ncbi:MAG: SDR family oxidoreductase [Candidatus Omnitrophota bacterium]